MASTRTRAKHERDVTNETPFQGGGDGGGGSQGASPFPPASPVRKTGFFRGHHHHAANLNSIRDDGPLLARTPILVKVEQIWARADICEWELDCIAR